MKVAAARGEPTLGVMIGISKHDHNLTSRGRRAATLRLVKILDMGPMEFKAFQWAAQLGPFAPMAIAHAPPQPMDDAVLVEGVPVVG